VAKLTNKQLLSLNADLSAQLAIALAAIAELTIKVSSLVSVPVEAIAVPVDVVAATVEVVAVPVDVVAATVEVVAVPDAPAPKVFIETVLGNGWIDRSCVYLSTRTAQAKRLVLAALYKGSNRTVRYNGVTVTVRTYA
jgi:hypothetical protein